MKLNTPCGFVCKDDVSVSPLLALGWLCVEGRTFTYNCFIIYTLVLGWRVSLALVPLLLIYIDLLLCK